MGRLDAYDQEAATACLDHAVTGLQVRFLLQYCGYIQRSAVLGFLPSDITVGEIGAGRITHGLLQGLLELRLRFFLRGNVLENCLERDISNRERRIFTEIHGLAVVLEGLMATAGWRVPRV